jgi:tRNA pseudouridine38-40 synthase
VSAPDVRDDLDLGRLMDALNGMLGPHISIISARAAAPDFDARFSARSRTYVYAILRRSTPDPFLSGTALWHRDELEIETMNEAAGHLVGAHDFSSFGRVEEGGSAERNLFELRVARSGDLVKIRARANAFIHQMVRSLVGTMIYVGEGRRDPGDIPAILAARDRSAAGPVAPAHGLCLVAVEYDEGWSVPPHPGS